MKQSSRLPLSLPACIVLVACSALVGSLPLQAQQRYRVQRAENFRRAGSPTAPVLARVQPGAVLHSDSGNGEWVQVTLAGWVWAASVEPTNRDGHDLRVAPTNGENLRDAPNGSVVARLAQGTLLDEVTRNARWVRIERSGWMWAESLEAMRAGGAVPAPSPQSTELQATLDRAVIAHETPLLKVPEGQETAALGPDTPVKVLARSGEWVRVQTEGWVRETDLRPSAAGVLEGVSGAEVRASPEEFEGRLLQWTLQYLSVQEADELRSEIPMGQRYMLARGPLPEAGFVYVTLSDTQVAQVERLAPLTQIVIIGRVRIARSRYLGNPIVELVDMAIRQQ